MKTLSASLRLWGCAAAAAAALPTQVTPYGTATPGCAGTATIGTNSDPIIGNTGFAFTCTGAMPLAPGGMLLGLAPASPPFFVSGALVWVSGVAGGTFYFVTMNGAGSASVPLAIPSDPGLPGLPLYSQFLWSDPGFTCAGTGLLAATQGLNVTIQGCPGAPINTCANAASLATGTPVTGWLCPSGDEDWYVFSLTAPSRIVATMTPPAGLNYNLELRSACATVLASSTNATGTETITRCMSPGTYRLRVVGAAGANSGTAPYSISLASTASTATPLTLTSPAVACATGTRWHPTLHTTSYVHTGPCPVTVTVTVQATSTTTCGGASFSIDYASSSLPFPVSIAAGGSPANLVGTFTAQPGETYEVGLVTGYSGGACSSTCGGTLTIR